MIFKKNGRSTARTLEDYGLIAIFVISSFLIRIFFLKYKLLFVDNDAIGYINWSQSIQFSFPEFFETIPIMVGPLYPLFVRIFHELAKSDPAYCARFVSVIFGSLLLVPFFLFVRNCYDKRMAIISSILLLFSSFLIEISLNALTESSFLFFFFFSLYFMLVAYRSSSLLSFFCGGMCLSISYLIRPEAFLYLLIFYIGIIYYGKIIKWKILKIFTFGLVFTLGFSILSVPYISIVHNRTGNWTISGKTRNIFAQHGVDRKDPFWYDKTFYGLSENGTEVAVNANSFDNTGTLDAFFVDLPGEIKSLVWNLYNVYRDALPQIFSPLWFVLMGIGVLMKIKLYFGSKDLRTIDNEIFLIAILFPYILIISLHNLALRHFAATVPLFIILTGLGINQTSEFLSNFSKKKTYFPHLVPILLLSALFLLELPDVRHLKNPGASAHLQDSPIFIKAGKWIKSNLPPKPRIMSRKPFLPFYADGTWVALPFASYDKILNYAKAKEVEYLDINNKQITSRPQLKFLLSDDHIPESLELLKTFRHKADELRLYRLK